MKRNIILIVVGLFITLPFVNSCKKGPEDPFFSFRSRKARIVGNWNITKLDDHREVTKGEEVDDMAFSIDETVSGTSWKWVKEYYGTDSVHERKGKILEYKMTFDDNGYVNGIMEIEIVETTKYPDAATPYDSTATTNIKKEFSGTWDFMSGVDDYKKKERLIVVFEEITETTKIISLLEFDDEETDNVTILHPLDDSKQTYGNGEHAEIYRLRSLKNKEIIYEQELNNDYFDDEANTTLHEVGTILVTMTLDEAN